MDRYAASLARAVGPDSPQLLPLIRNPPDNSRELLLTMLQALTDNALPPKQLVEACIANFTTSKDVRLLAPVTVAMLKADVIRLLPQLVAQLSKPQLRLLYRRLTHAVAGADVAAHFKPTELLVALHQIRSTPSLRVTTKQQTAALDVALHAPEVFPVAVVVQVRGVLAAAGGICCDIVRVCCLRQLRQVPPKEL
jgi:symplekin